jgi:hypothetical protein
LIENIKKCEFGKESLIYIRQIIGGGEMRVDLNKIPTIDQWSIPTSLTEVRSFVGAYLYLNKLIGNLLVVETPLHSMTTNGKSFHWGKAQQQEFEDLKRNINNAPVLAMPNLQ